MEAVNPHWIAYELKTMTSPGDMSQDNSSYVPAPATVALVKIVRTSSDNPLFSEALVLCTFRDLGVDVRHVWQ